MLWAARTALAGILLGGASTVAIAADVDLIGANRAAAPAARQDSKNGQWLIDPRSGCRALDVNFDEGDTASWSGACQNNLAEGAGTLTFSNEGAVVETIAANLHRGILQDGHVVAAWADGSKYDGDEVGGHMNGAGIFTSPKGDKLEGQWANDALGGRVRIAWANGDRYEGDWRDGAANGQGSEIWANGDRYDGDWRDGKAEGTGSQKWADGRSYNGTWHNDQPMQTLARASAPARPSATVASGMNAVPQLPVSMAANSANVAGTIASVPATMIASTASSGAPADATAQSQTAILDGLAGTQLVSVDGSSIAFSATEAGFTREIARPDGAHQATAFNFINDRLGTITTADDPSQTIGLFRVTDSEIDINYADGRSEVLTPNRNGGLSIALAAPNGGAYCMSWYPQGHMFSDAERKAAVTAYANRLSAAPNSPQPSAGTCADNAIAKTADAPVAAPVQTSITTLQNVPRPIPKPMRVSYLTQSPAPWPSRAPVPFTQKMPFTQKAPFAQNMSGVVVVKDSTVHTIDAGADPSAPASPQASIDPATLPDSASSCLSVDSDGGHWGFRNHCGYNVQFAYCLMSDPDGLAACRDGGVTGSVAPNGFGALVADKSIKETGGDHDFRWIACSGGTGEVVPHLDRSDPPAGRCVRPKAS